MVDGFAMMVCKCSTKLAGSVSPITVKNGLYPVGSRYRRANFGERSKTPQAFVPDSGIGFPQCPDVFCRDMFAHERGAVEIDSEGAIVHLQPDAKGVGHDIEKEELEQLVWYGAVELLEPQRIYSLIHFRGCEKVLVALFEYTNRNRVV